MDKIVTWMKAHKIWSAIIGVFLLFVLIGALAPAEEAAPKTKPEEPAATSPKPAPESKTNAPEPASLKEQMEDQLDDTDVDVMSVKTANGKVTVEFKLDDNFSSDMIATGAKEQTVDIIKQGQDVRAKNLVIMGYFPLVDQYGNTEDSLVLNVGYPARVLNKINTDEILVQDGIWNLAVWPTMVHPELQN